MGELLPLLLLLWPNHVHQPPPQFVAFTLHGCSRKEKGVWGGGSGPDSSKIVRRKKGEASFPLISSYLLLRYGVPLNFFHSSLRSQEIRGNGEDSRKSLRRSVARQECALVCPTKNDVEKFALFLSPSSYFTFAARQTGLL